jgi:hypothetical protein
MAIPLEAEVEGARQVEANTRLVCTAQVHQLNLQRILSIISLNMFAFNVRKILLTSRLTRIQAVAVANERVTFERR